MSTTWRVTHWVCIEAHRGGKLGIYNSLTAFEGNTERKCRHIGSLISQLIPAWAPCVDAEWTVEN
jgi:hypothetical protein